MEVNCYNEGSNREEWRRFIPTSIIGERRKKKEKRIEERSRRSRRIRRNGERNYNQLKSF